jgi:tetratricopeptide (TPR) repeat protein
MRTPLAGPTLVLLAASLCRAQPSLPSREYLGVVRQYAAGEYESAVARAASWPPSRVGLETRALADLSRRAADCVVCPAALEWQRLPVLAALMLHTDCALGARKVGMSAAPHEEAAQRVADAVADDPTRAVFLARWYSVMAGLAEGENRWEDALDWAVRATRALPRSAVAQHVIGCVEETMASVDAPPAEEGSTPAQREHLDKAFRAFEAALVLDPSLADARLRLGRVAQRLGQDDLARTTFAQVLASATQRDTLYLAHLFVGGLDEAAGRPGEAARSYGAAVVLIPSCQCARLALSHVLLRQGDRQRARLEVERAVAPGGSRLRPDPFWLYPWGPSVGAAERLAELRQEASP